MNVMNQFLSLIGALINGVSVQGGQQLMNSLSTDAGKVSVFGEWILLFIVFGIGCFFCRSFVSKLFFRKRGDR